MPTPAEGQSHLESPSSSIGLTYVEFGIQESEATLYPIMFTGVLVINLAFAIDAYRIAREEVTTAEPATV
jgi:hypothetical protein